MTGDLRPKSGSGLVGRCALCVGSFILALAVIGCTGKRASLGDEDSRSAECVTNIAAVRSSSGNVSIIGRTGGPLEGFEARYPASVTGAGGVAALTSDSIIVVAGETAHEVDFAGSTESFDCALGEYRLAVIEDLSAPVSGRLTVTASDGEVLAQLAELDFDGEQRSVSFG